MEEVTELKYLGAILSTFGDMKEEIRKNALKVRRVIGSLNIIQYESEDRIK